MIENINSKNELKDEYGNPIEFAKDGVIGDHLLEVNGDGSQNKYGENDEKHYSQYSNRFV